MNDNIKTAASLLRKASYDLQYRARQLQFGENNLRHQLEREENKIKNSMLAMGIKMSSVGGESQDSTSLARHTYELYRHKKQVEADTAKKVSSEKKKIYSLQSQARELDKIAHTLEMWSW